ncbi:MAG: ABC transporter permease, partial [Pseudomonadota bacterium]
MSTAEHNHVEEAPTRSRRARVARRILRNSGIIIGGGLLLVIVLAAVFAPLITSAD